MTAVLDGRVTVPALDVQVVTITPNMAAHWLEEYKGPNRNISDLRVAQYQSDMESGRWRFEGAPIKISKTGKLLDGQHRLTALAGASSTVELPFLVVYGLDDEAQLYMDMVMPRTAGQQLQLKGLKDTAALAAVVKLYLDWTRDRLFKSNTRCSTSKPEVITWTLNHPELVEVLALSQYRKVDAPVSVMGAFYLAVHQASPAKADEFMQKLTSGANLIEGDPILALIHRLGNIRRNGQAVTQREYLALIIKAWNAWVMGDSLQKVQIPKMTPETFPELLQVPDSK